MTSVIGQRALVGRALFDVIRRPSFRAWLEANAAGAVDADGDLVSISIAEGEEAWVLVSEATERDHDVIMCTLHQGQMVAWVLGPALATGAAASANDLPIVNGMTVGDVVDQMMQLQRGAEYVLRFGRERHRAVLAPVAAAA